MSSHIDTILQNLNRFIYIGENREAVAHAQHIIQLIIKDLKQQSKAFSSIFSGAKIAGMYVRN